MNRYDISPFYAAECNGYNTVMWEVVDIQNNNAGTGHFYQTREKALQAAKNMDRKGR